MFFYVDESGHTGPNLFDESQPMLYYGVASSKLDIDRVAEPHLKKLRKQLFVERLHANELGNGRLSKIAHEIVGLQKRLSLNFDIYRIAKPDHALICFFDQVFDQGNNPAVTWTGYWTPLRYILLLKVAVLFDEEALKLAWNARIELNDEKAESMLIEVCRTIRGRVGELPDARSRQIIGDALRWAEQNPKEIYYNAKKKSDLLSITPNLIGFQSVMHGIAARIKKGSCNASRIVVDQQSQFNKTQRSLAKFFSDAREVPFVNGPGLPELDFSGMPTTPITFMSSNESAGLEVVDIYLWVFKRFLEEKELAPELYALIKGQLQRGITDEISINAISSRWSSWFSNLPEQTPEEEQKAREIMAIDEERRISAIRNT